MKLILILLSIEQEEKQSHVARAHPVQFAFFSLHLILLFFFLLLLSSSCWRFAFVRWLAVAMAHLFCLECCCYLSCCCQWMTQKNIIKFLIQLFLFSAADEIALNFHYLIIVALLLLIGTRVWWCRKGRSAEERILWVIRDGNAELFLTFSSQLKLLQCLLHVHSISFNGDETIRCGMMMCCWDPWRISIVSSARSEVEIRTQES